MNIGVLAYSGVSVDRLLAFTATYQAGSLVKAAGGDPTRQSQLSRQIGDLERALGISLFDRQKRRLVPTKAAKELYLLLQDFGSGLNELVEREKTRQQRFRIGANRFVLESFAITRIAVLRKKFPDTSWVFRSGTTQEICTQVRNGDLDIGIVRQDAQLEGLGSRPFITLDYVLAVHRDLLPERSAAGFHIISQLPILILSGEGRYVTGVEAMVRQYKLKLNIIAEFDSFELILRALEEDSLAAVLPRTLALRLPSDRYAIVEDEALASLQRLLVVIYRPDPEKESKVVRILDAIKVPKAKLV